MRARFYITWSVKISADPNARFLSADMAEEFARAQLVSGFADARSEVTVLAVRKTLLGAAIDFTWDISLNPTPGAWHMPEDHARHAIAALVEAIPGDGLTMEVEIFREADFREAIDHGEINLHAVENGLDAGKADFPIFRPERHPDWPEADEVFLQEGVWVWNETGRDNQGFSKPGPSFGPDPKRIFALWDPEDRYRRYAEPRADDVRPAGPPRVHTSHASYPHPPSL